MNCFRRVARDTSSDSVADVARTCDSVNARTLGNQLASSSPKPRRARLLQIERCGLDERSAKQVTQVALAHEAVVVAGHDCVDDGLASPEETVRVLDATQSGAAWCRLMGWWWCVPAAARLDGGLASPEETVRVLA